MQQKQHIGSRIDKSQAALATSFSSLRISIRCQLIGHRYEVFSTFAMARFLGLRKQKAR